MIFNVLIDSWNVEVSLSTERQLLKREEVFKDETTRLKEHMCEILLSVSGLEDTEAAWVSETCVEPATN